MVAPASKGLSLSRSRWTAGILGTAPAGVKEFCGVEGGVLLIAGAGVAWPALLLFFAAGAGLAQHLPGTCTQIGNALMY
jgi:hypothetical protein